MFAHFEVRRKDLSAARRILGQAIGRCPKDQIFKQYIQLELNLVNVDRCRTLYGKYLQWAPHNCLAWTRYAQLEASVNEHSRARSLYELAVNQQLLDMPELLWKSYIDFEIALGEHERARVLYERLLERTAHVKVFISFAQFEATTAGDAETARGVFDRACVRGRWCGILFACCVVVARVCVCAAVGCLLWRRGGLVCAPTNHPLLLFCFFYLAFCLVSEVGG